MKFLPFLAMLALAACSQSDLEKACVADATIQPVAVVGAGVAGALVPGAAAPVAAGVALDQSVVHPGVVAACAAVKANAAK